MMRLISETRVQSALAIPAYHRRMFEIGAAYAVRPQPYDLREHKLGAVGMRSDGVLVRARNGNSPTQIPGNHAEWRLCRKLDMRAEVWVVRVRKSGEYGLARPCRWCMKRLLDSAVRRVYYSVSTSEYGVLTL